MWAIDVVGHPDYGDFMENIVKFMCVVSGALLLSGCDGTFSNGGGLRANPPDNAAPLDGPNDAGNRPKPRPDGLENAAPKPVQTAHTVEQFDTTTTAQRADAIAAAPASGERKLGATVGSLGDPTEPGFWLKTPLVSVASKGRLEYPSNGKSVAVNLIPIDGPKTAGSRVSLAALRLIGAPLTGLPELVVYAD